MSAFAILIEVIAVSANLTFVFPELLLGIFEAVGLNVLDSNNASESESIRVLKADIAWPTSCARAKIVRSPAKRINWST